MKFTKHDPNDDWQLVHAQRASYGSLNRNAIDRLLSPIRDNVQSGLKFVIDLHSATNYGADLLGELVRLSLQLKQHGGRLRVRGDHLGLIALLGMQTAIESANTEEKQEEQNRPPFRRRLGLQSRFRDSSRFTGWTAPELAASVASR